MTFAEYATRWLVQRTARLTPNAVRAYRAALVHHVLPTFGAEDLQDITTPAIRAWLGVQLASGRSTNAIKSALASLSTVLMDALIDGEVTHNAAHGAGRRLLPGRTTTAPKAMTPHELACFLVAARTRRDGWSADAFLVYSRTGLRLGELLALQKRSVLLSEHALRVEQTYQGGAFGFGPPKSGKARIVEFSEGTAQVLTRRVDQLETAGGFLFPGADPRLPMHPSTVEWAFGQAASIAALPEHYTVHSLRHTYASILLAAGAPATWVQQQLGHAAYQITVDLYGSWLRQRRPDLTAILDQEPAHHGIVRAERPKVVPIRRRSGR